MRLKIGVFILGLSLASSGFAADKLTVLLDWFVNPDHAPLFVAEHQHFFRDENLVVKMIGPADPADPPKLVAAGQADIAITYQPQFLQAIDHGLPLAMIGALIKQPLSCLVVLKDSGIRSIKDLIHKKIGFSGAGINSISLRIMLNHHGVQLDQVDLINTHYGLTQALLSHRVDAVTGMMRNIELTQLALAGHPGLAFYPEQHGMPNYNELIFIVHKAHKNDAVMQRFLRAVQKGQAYLQTHVASEWFAFADAHPELDNPLNKQAWFSTVAMFAKEPATIDVSEVNRFARFMLKNGLIAKLPNESAYSH